MCIFIESVIQLFLKRRRYLAALCAGVIVAVIWLVPSTYGSVDFPVIEKTLIYNVNDAGVADFNGDDRLDRWTTNHSAAQWIDMGADQSEIGTDVAIAAGLAQDANLPGFAQGDRKIPRLKPVRFFMDDTAFVIDVGDLGNQRLKGKFIVPWEIRTATSGDGIVQVEACEVGPYCHAVRFAAGSGARIIVEPIPVPSDGFTTQIMLEPDIPLEQIQIGALALSPTSHQFTYASKDRHGMALTDLTADGTPDLFISRGGVRGELQAVGPDDRDELFTWTDQGFVSTINDSGITKDGCSGRQVAWIDVNDDGLKDIYQVCGRANAPGNEQANRLYLQDPDLHFTEAGAGSGFDLPGIGSFYFFRNPSFTAPLSMLWAKRDRVSLFAVIDGKLDLVWELPRAGGNFDKIIMLDADPDAPWKAVLFSPKGNMIFELSETAPQIIDAAPLGLPAASTDGVYLDINADGIRDVFTLPQGLFLGTPNGFEHTDAIDLVWLGMAEGVRFAWFDADGDNDLDLWLLQRGGNRANWAVRWIYARAPDMVRGWLDRIVGRERLRFGHWFSLVFENRIAETGNHLFVPVSDSNGPLDFGIPVMVTTVSNGQETTQFHLTGEADSSRFSQTLGDLFIALPGQTEIITVQPLMSVQRP